MKVSPWELNIQGSNSSTRGLKKKKKRVVTLGLKRVVTQANVALKKGGYSSKGGLKRGLVESSFVWRSVGKIPEKVV